MTIHATLKISPRHAAQFDPLNSEAVLAFSPNNEAVIAESPSINLARVYDAVAGSAIIVQNVQDVSASRPNEGDLADPNPRTLAGLSRHGRYLYLVVIDGHVPGFRSAQPTSNPRSSCSRSAAIVR